MSTVISSLESIPLPATAPQIRRPARNPVGAKSSQALVSSASESRSIVPVNSVDGEYVETTQSVERKVEPISRTVLSSPGTTMEQLHEMATHELDVLDALSNEGRQIIKTRLMAIWEEMSVRFDRGESINGISGTGGKGMGKYLRSLGIDPAKRRYWKLEIRQKEALRLAQENPPPPKRGKKREILINSETEADLIAKAGIRMAQLLACDNMTSPQERVNKAGAMAKNILEAIADGQYAQLEPLPPPAETPVPETATFEDWQRHQLPAPDYKLKYFADASENFSRNYMCSFEKSGFKKIVQTLRDKPDQVRSNAQDFAQLATMLRAMAENANLLAAAIFKAVTPSPASEYASIPEAQQNEKHVDPADSELTVLANEETGPQESEPESLTPDAPASVPPSIPMEKSKGKLTPRKVVGASSTFAANLRRERDRLGITVKVGPPAGRIDLNSGTFVLAPPTETKPVEPVAKQPTGHPGCKHVNRTDLKPRPGCIGGYHCDDCGQIVRAYAAASSSEP